MLRRLYHWPLPQPSVNLFQPRHLCLANYTVNIWWELWLEARLCRRCAQLPSLCQTQEEEEDCDSECLVGLVSCELISIPGLSVSVIYFLITITRCLKLQVHLLPQPACEISARTKKFNMCLTLRDPAAVSQTLASALGCWIMFGTNFGAIEMDSSIGCILLVVWVTFLWLSAHL